jgi:hypothetical protein
MRSGGGVSTLTNNTPKEQAKKPDAKCKGATTIPIFLKKTYKMIETCDPNIASWTEDGEMFTIKNPDLFATEVIPQYFDHNKFSSFARQLNFYGFRKMQAKPIRNADFDRSTAKHVTFFNEKFKRGRCDLLKEIQRSTRGGGTANNLAEHSKEVEALKAHVAELEETVKITKRQMEERMTKLELDMLGQMEQMMLAMQQNQQAQFHMQRNSSVASGVVMPSAGEGWDAPAGANRRTSVSSIFSSAPMVSSEGVGQQDAAKNPGATTAAPTAAPTLPPHPKQKQLPQGVFPMNSAGPPSRLNSLRGISTLNRGLSRGLSVESTASAQLMRSSWEDKFFSMLMLGESEATAVAAANSAAEQASANANASSGMSPQGSPGVPASGPVSDSMEEDALAEAAAAAGVGIGTPSLDDLGKRGSLSSIDSDGRV